MYKLKSDSVFILATVLLFLLSGLHPLMAQNIKEQPFEYSPELLVSAENGDVDAMYKIGICYYVGKAGAPTLITNAIPLEQDYEKAYEYLKGSADKGSVLAMLNLGNIYKSGIGAPKGKDIKKALEWYEKAGEEGCSDAYANIAKVYETEMTDLLLNKIVKIKDASEAANILWDKAVEFNILAAEKGSAIGAYNLGVAYNSGLLNRVIDYEESTKWFRRASELGYSKAINDLAVRYLNGIGVPLNKRMALELIRKAAENGEPMALHNIGVFYYNGGFGLPQDKDKAVWYFMRANMLGYNNSQALKECYIAKLCEADKYATENDWLIHLKAQCTPEKIPTVEIPEPQVMFTVEAGNVVNDCGSWSIVDKDGIWITDRRYDKIVQDATSGKLTAGLYGYSTPLREDGSEERPILEQMVNSLEGDNNLQNIFAKSLQLLQADHDNAMGYRAIAYYNIAVYYHNSNLLPASENYLLKSLEIDPDFSAAQESLALLQKGKKEAKKAAKKERRALIWDCIFTGIGGVANAVGQVAAIKQEQAYQEEMYRESNREKNKARIRELKQQGKSARQNMVGMINRRAVSNAYTEGVGRLTDYKNSGLYGSEEFHKTQQEQQRLSRTYGITAHESETW